ncbi:MAG: hypothetical protein VW437_05625 [Betaproteobacteria bacterium]|jgi:hypothetical protein
MEKFFKLFLRSFTALTLMVSVGAVYSDETDTCPRDENWIECRAEQGDLLAIYKVARESYDKAYDQVKSTGLADFTVPLSYGRQLVDSKERNGKRLLKMVHLQLSWGNHVNRDQALQWLKEDYEQRKLDYLPVLINRLAPGQVN